MRPGRQTSEAGGTGRIDPSDLHQASGGTVVTHAEGALPWASRIDAELCIGEPYQTPDQEVSDIWLSTYLGHASA